MEPGELRHRVMIQRLRGTRTARGGPGDQYDDWFETWAEVLDLNPEESWQAQQIAPGITTKVRIRYRAGIDSTCRVRRQSRTGSPTIYEFLDVVGIPVEVEGRKDEIWLMCTKREAEGFRTGELA